MALKIVAQYGTEKGTLFPTYKEALVADALEKMSGIYIEDYKLKYIVKGLSEIFDFIYREEELPSPDLPEESP